MSSGVYACVWEIAVCVCVAVIDRCPNLSVVLHLMLTDTAALESLPQKDPVLDSVSARGEK